MGSNNQPKLLPARIRVTQALQQAQETPFTPEKMEMMKNLPVSKKKKSLIAALASLQGNF